MRPLLKKKLRLKKAGYALYTEYFGQVYETIHAFIKSRDQHVDIVIQMYEYRNSI